ncbi:immunoglobulin-like domain-containing protein [Enterococcus termitis]
MNQEKKISKKKLYTGIGLLLFGTLLATGVIASNLLLDTEAPNPKITKTIENNDSKESKPKAKQGEKEKKDSVQKTYDKYGVVPKTDFPRTGISNSSSLSPRELQTVARVINQQKEEKAATSLPVFTPTVTGTKNPDPVKKPEVPIEPIIPPAVKSTPVIHFQDGIVIVKGQNFDPYAYFSVEDTLDPNVQIFVDTSDLNLNAVGSQSFIVVATNKYGETAVATVPVFVASKPVINLTSNEVELVIGNEFNFKNYVQAFDELDGDLTVNVELISSTINNEKEGVYSADYAVTNSYGVTTTITLTVRVINEAPTIYAPEISHEINQNFDPLTGVTAIAFNGEKIDLTEENVIENTVDVTTEGTYYVTYKVTDRFGKESEFSKRIVTVENEGPVLNGVEDLEFSVGTILTEQLLLSSVNALDREDDKLGLSVDVKLDQQQFSEIDVEVPGIYPLTYIAIDSMGKETRKEIKITILGDIPVIHGVLDTEVELNVSFDPLAEISVTDTEDGIIPASEIVITGVVDTTKEGEYILTYQVKDSHGQQSEIYTRKVTVKATVTKMDSFINTISSLVMKPDVVKPLDEHIKQDTTVSSKKLLRNRMQRPLSQKKMNQYKLL